MSPALILLAHGARDPEWARPLERLRAAIQSARPAVPTALAFLEFMNPTLSDAIDGLAAAGALHIRVVPVFLAQGGHVKRDLPVILEAARARHPRLEISLALAVGESDAVIAAMAQYALAEILPSDE